MSFTDINHFSISLSFIYWNITGLVVTRTIFRNKFPTMLFENSAWKAKLELCMTVTNNVNVIADDFEWSSNLFQLLQTFQKKI